MSDSVDEEEEPEYVEMLTNYRSFLCPTNMIISSCLNSKETSETVDRNSPGTDVKHYKHSILWDCDLSLQELLRVLRVYAKKMRRRASLVNFDAYVYHQLRVRTAVVTEK
ncbi:uncharacterized protein CYBJADRAFT_173381 [Cyberlindnera jadinii NRRL Y-1542]|uniref:Uncharacterized protein n=1 Tax=Cyberlindnera jadinii (strain ATCC 18201 / CBS 1600 / BCRC 20928 / JCM 3617 / NBRC 0987 / NRRL Y-1542) TaxID=983966 RepID=A0A1E4S1N3_CYBJN|nr:hypothetical protein CYBJADRAFT_173381 [Cyberlindnera jadinii NRRL Y-1542]ODV73382.1 hypothetical protein CYBJADRAFT_173381 [Cyberlindnera jadinii NRRL Y-1542]